MSPLHFRGVQMMPGEIILQNLKRYEECEKSSHSLYSPNSSLLLCFKIFFGTSYGLDNVEMSLLHLRDVQIMPKKIKHKKYFKIRNCTKNVRIPHILCILLIFHFFDALKIFWDFIWLGYCLNDFITLMGC